jgi:hypothetical protein
MNRLQAITYRLPHSEASTAFLSALRTMLAVVPYVAAAPGRIQLTPPAPAGALPVTVFELADVPGPQLRCGDAWSLNVDAAVTPVAAGPLSAAPTEATRSSAVRPPPAAGSPEADTTATVAPRPPMAPHTAAFSTAAASGTAASTVAAAAAAEPPGVDMADAAALLGGHVAAVDHTGVNLPAATVPPVRWADIVAAIAEVSTLYRYPTGEPWLFVLPSTQSEHADDIRDFPDGREPRFEVVHDEWLDGLLWQFALHTDLSREELEAMFPEPAGVAFPGLGEVFRAVTVRSPWPGMQLRLDLYYHRGLRSDWETGEWLVAEGGRIRRERGVRNNDAS